MNAILKTKGSFIAYTVLVFSLATIYAVLTGRGTGIGAADHATDALSFGILYGLIGIIMWNILRYVVPKRNGELHPLWSAFTIIMATGNTVAIECLVMWACLGDGFGAFAPTIMLRFFITGLIYTCFFFYHRGSIQAEEEPVPTVAHKAPQADILERVTLKTGGKIKVINLADIEYLQADGDYVAIITHDGRWLKEQTMKYFEEHLPAEHFVRIHRSYIVGVGKIARIERYGNLYQVALRNGEKIKVSATGYRLLKEQLNI